MTKRFLHLLSAAALMAAPQAPPSLDLAGAANTTRTSRASAAWGSYTVRSAPDASIQLDGGMEL